MAEKNPFAKLSKSNLTGEEKTEKFKELARALKSKTSDEPRSNVGEYDESKYDPTRKKFIIKARRAGLTSEEDREKQKNIKKAARMAKKGLKAIPGVGLAMEILDPTEVGSAEVPYVPEDISSEEGSFKKGGRVKKFKGGLMRGIPKIAMRGY